MTPTRSKLTDEEKRERERQSRLRGILSIDAHNADPISRLKAVVDLYELGHEAILDGFIAEAQSIAYLIQERLAAHKFMIFNVERGQNGG